jgi:hypothetical protein
VKLDDVLLLVEERNHDLEHGRSGRVAAAAVAMAAVAGR